MSTTLDDAIDEAVAKAVAPLAATLREQDQHLRALLRRLPPAFGSVSEAAHLLGVSRKTVERLISRGEISSKKVGRLVRVDLAALRVVDDEDLERDRAGRAG